MGKNSESNSTGRISAGIIALRQNIVKVAGMPASLIEKSKESSFARWDSIYEASRVVAIKYVEELRTEFPEKDSPGLIAYMKEQVLDSARTNSDTDFLVDNLTLYVCVTLELSGGSNVEVLARRKCMKLIETTRKLNKARRVFKKVETAARITAAIAALLPDKGKLAPIKKVGVDVSMAMAAKDELQAQLVNAFEKNGITNPGLQAIAKKVIAETSKILDSSNLEQKPRPEELQRD
jgi:hypothetical protein